MTQLTPTANARSLDQDAAGRPGIISDLMTLTKVRITLMVAITAFVGFALGVEATTTSWSWLTLLGAMAGTSISCMGAAALNQVYERDVDAKMHRTRTRPVPAGRIRSFEATLLGVGLSCLGVFVLLVTTHWLAALLSGATILSYVFAYTPLKQRTPHALLVGTIPGAAPPLIGYAAATGTLGASAWLVFAIMVVWQVPHFLAIAWLYREDYARSGMPMTPVLDPGGGRTSHQALLGCLLLLPLGVLPTYLGISGLFYFAVALLTGIAFLSLAALLAAEHTRARARALFVGSLIYLPLLLAIMVLDHI